MLFKKTPGPSQPHADWPWTLSEGGHVLQTFTWENIEYDLAELYPDNDSFVILEQTDPKDSQNYWYIQSAIALKGPDQGKYIVGCGWPGKDGPLLVERCYEELDDVIGIFEQAFQRKPLDLSGYENFEL